MTDSTLPGKLVHDVFGKVLRADLTPTLHAELTALGIPIDAPPAAPVARSAWYQAIERTSAAIFPGRPVEAQLRALGRHLIASLEHRKIVKGPFLAMARLMGPRRAIKQSLDFLDRAPLKITVTERSKSHYEVTVDDPNQPQFLAGVLEEAIELLGGKGASVTVGGPLAGGAGLVFEATWR